MNKILTAVFIAFTLAVSLSGHADDVHKVKTIELKNPKDMQDAMIMQNANHSLNAKVMECIDKKLAQPRECPCLYPAELSQAQEVYANTLNRHPDWRDQAIFWWPDGSPSYQLSFYGLRHKLEQKCLTLRSSGTAQKRAAP